MKKFMFALLMSVCVSFLAGCEPENRYDYFNTDITIYVTDAEGVNLCSPRLAGVGRHILFDLISIDYDGKNYPMAATGIPNDPKNPASRATEIILPEWTEDGRKPLRWNHRWENDAALLFGQFSADTKAYYGEEFTINWGDNSKTEIKFDLYPSWEDGGDQPVVKQAIWVKDKSGEWQIGSENSLEVTIVR
jgi:hypothetical protein